MKKIVELQEDIDFTELNKAYLKVVDKYEFKARHSEIGFTCRPGAIDRVYDSVGRKSIEETRNYPEFAVEFIDTYFYELWQKYDCDRAKLWQIDFSGNFDIVPGKNTQYNYIIIPIVTPDFYIFWANHQIVKQIEPGKVYLINNRDRHIWVNLSYLKTGILFVIVLSEKSKHNKLLE